MPDAKATTIRLMPTSSGLRQLMTNSASGAMTRSVLAASVRRFIGRMTMSAGRKVSVRNSAPSTPTATTLPSSRKGGEMEKFSARKPMAVVRHATAISPPCSASATRAHSRRSGVSVMVWRTLASTWTTLATASVMMMSGARMVTELSITPDQPSAPSPITADMAITVTVIATPTSERKARKTISRIAPNISGVRLAPSSWPDTANWFETMTDPVMRSSISGCSARKATASACASSTIIGTSVVGSMPGRRNMTCIEPKRPVGSTIVCTSSGRDSAISRASAAISGVTFAGSGTRSCTIISSPMA